MTSPWWSVLISSPGMTTRSRVARELDRLERAAEDVVVGHGDAAEPDRLGVVEQILGGDRAVVRPLGMEVEVDSDPLAIRERIDGLAARSAALAHELRVDGVELGSDGLEALALRALAGVEGCAGAGAGVGDETLDLALGPFDRSVDGCGLASRRLECESFFSSRCRDEDRRAGERLRPLRARTRGADVHARAEPARYRRAKAERLRVEQRGLPVGRALEEPEKSACRRAAGDLELDRDEVALRGRAESRQVHAEGNDPVVALEALGRRLRGLVRGREQRIDTRSQPVATGAPRGVDQAIDGEERRRGQRVRRREREVREAREARFEAVDDVEAATREREPQVRADRDRDAHVRSPRERDRRADRDDVRVVGRLLERAATGDEVARARRGRKHGHLVPEATQRGGGSVDVRVDLVRLRPRERRDEADPETHPAQVTTCNLAPWAKSRSRHGRTGRTGSGAGASHRRTGQRVRAATR